MATKVKTKYMRSFSIPNACVACGDSPGLGTNKEVSGQQGASQITLGFPLCQECYEASKGSGIGRLLSGKSLTPDHRERRNLVKRSVRIVSLKMPGLLFNPQGSIVFEFADPSFAAEFARMNLGQII